MAPQFNQQQRAFMAKLDWQTQSYVEVRRRYARRYPPPRNRVPSTAAIKWNVDKFDAYGTVRNRHKEACGARRSVRTRPNIVAVRQSLRRNPKSSCRVCPGLLITELLIWT